MKAKKAQSHWSQLTAALLVVIVIVVVVIIFATKTGESQKDIGRCGGLIGADTLSGECLTKSSCTGPGKRTVSTFGSDCGEGEVCCIIET